MVKGPLSQIGPYRVEARIGSGGMATVYRAVREDHSASDRPVALKVLHPELCKSPEYTDMFHAEGELASRLSHPVLVSVTDRGVIDNTHYMAMDLLEGQTLAELYDHFRKKKRSFPVPHTLWILARVLDGLHFAHSLTLSDGQPCNVVHRDLSPRNIVLTRTGEVRLLDFGIARSEVRKGQTQIGIVKGTVPYMAPEQARGEALDRRCDVFGVGIVLHQLLTDSFPLDCKATDAQRNALALEQIKPQLKRIHLSLRGIVTRSLQTEPEQRYDSAEEMATALRKALDKHYPKHRPEMLGALISQTLRRQTRPRKGRQQRAPTQTRPSLKARHDSRIQKALRHQIPSVILDPERYPPLPVVAPWDAARTLSLLATLLVLSGLMYVFIPLAT